MHKLIRRPWLLMALAMFFVLAFAGSCWDGTDDDNGNRSRAVEAREDNFTRAQQLYPDPKPSNFPLRAALVEFTARQDAINHPWFIYIMGMNGNYVGYFIGKTYPINSCNFLSSSEKVRDDESGNLVLTAPSLDGIYYGGAGSAAACDTYFFFDTETNAMHTFKAPMWFASDVPLDLDIPRLSAVQP